MKETITVRSKILDDHLYYILRFETTDGGNCYYLTDDEASAIIEKLTEERNKNSSLVEN